jgi:hypothetical protein
MQSIMASDNVMPSPAPPELARSIAGPLAGLDWAIGGSTLLYRLGIEPALLDLDIVTMVEHFDEAESRLVQLLGTGSKPGHPLYQSSHFTRFKSAAGTPMDLMAGIAVLVADNLRSWHFDPSRIDYHDGLPWMNARDWVVLYSLFDRPERAAQLRSLLAAAG